MKLTPPPEKTFFKKPSIIRFKSRTCYHFNDIIKFEYFNLDNILIDEKSCEKNLFHNLILVYSYKGAEPFRIRFGKIDGFIRVYDGATYLVLFSAERFDIICDRIRYLAGVKSGITYVISHNYAKIKVDLYDLVPLEKTLTLHGVNTH